MGALMIEKEDVCQQVFALGSDCTQLVVKEFWGAFFLGGGGGGV